MAEKITSAELLEYARVQVENNRPYWYATFGQIADAELLAYKRKQWPQQYEKWPIESFRSQFGQKVHDCSGLIKGAVFCNGDPNGIPKYDPALDFSANGMIAQCKEQGDISTLPEIPGLILWKNNHVGIYAGKGKVYEAKGHTYGCIRSAVGDTAWKKWGRLPFIRYEETPAPAPEPRPETMCTPTAPVLRRGEKNTGVRRLQAILNTYGAGLDIDGSFGPKTEAAVRAVQQGFKITVDGVVGAITWTKLLER